MTNPQAVEALRGNPADIYSRPWTRHGSGEDEWWSINGYTAKRDWRRTWVVRYRGVAVAEDNDLQQAMAAALLKNSADGHAQPAPQPEAQALPPCVWCCGTGRFSDHECRICGGSKLSSMAPALPARTVPTCFGAGDVVRIHDTALAVFHGCGQDARDAIEWYHSSLLVEVGVMADPPRVPAKLSSPAPAPLSAKLIDDAAEEWFVHGDCPGREASRKKAAKLSFKAGVKFAEEIRFIGLDGGM